MQKYSLNNHNVLLFFCEFKSVLNPRYFLPYAGSPPGPAESTTCSTGPGHWLPCVPSQDASGVWAACRSRPFLWLCLSSEHTAPLTCFFCPAGRWGQTANVSSHVCPTSQSEFPRQPSLTATGYRGNAHCQVQEAELRLLWSLNSWTWVFPPRLPCIMVRTGF